MGGGDFEFNPSLFDKKINRRNDYIEKALEGIENLLGVLATEYVKEGLGTRENFEKDIIKKMMLKRM